MSLAAIHIAKKELALTDAEYCAILWETAGVDSVKHLDAAGDRAVMARFNALRDEWRMATLKRIKTPTERKIWRLWLVESSPCVSRGRGDCCGNITAVYNNTSIILPG